MQKHPGELERIYTISQYRETRPDGYVRRYWVVFTQAGEIVVSAASLARACENMIRVLSLWRDTEGEQQPHHNQKEK